MRPWFRAVVVFLVLAGGTAGAQVQLAISTGFPAVFGVHVAFTDLLGPDVDLRINLGGSALAASGGLLFGAAVGADVLAYTANDQMARSGPYGGAGAGVVVLGAAGDGSVGAAFAANVSGIVGVAFDLGASDAFVELRGELSIPPGSPVIFFPGARLGLVFPL